MKTTNINWNNQYNYAYRTVCTPLMGLGALRRPGHGRWPTT
ncbi:hypothetical protein CORMATOL_02042 [Corynebacterium matruchotii ATCC 33806]|uniref:Uncharacterized protein n=1 Tax=Corynebacterium matruchotii ATCC 33806 TaxID=566549 RepID=C0E4W7_9CORY|nr:hypothetical protein CORMATOL_02042 [Corynebacterium matruchotii ATCC 33806]